MIDWQSERRVRDDRLNAGSKFAKGKILAPNDATALLEAVVRPGDRICLEGDNQKQASILCSDNPLVQQTQSKRIVPVQVFDDCGDWLHTGLSQQQPGDSLVGVLPMQDRIERAKRMFLIQRIEEVQ